MHNYRWKTVSIIQSYFCFDNVSYLCSRFCKL